MVLIAENKVIMMILYRVLGDCIVQIQMGEEKILRYGHETEVLERSVF